MKQNDGYASVKDAFESEMVEEHEAKQHWCSRVKDTNQEKLKEYQPYYAGDLTQK